MNIPVFVYGTLKRGHGNHRFLAGARFLGLGTTVRRYALHVDGLPMVDRDNPVSPIHGEVYLVNRSMLELLDRLEGHPAFYFREQVPVVLTSGEIVDAWLYFHPAPTGPVNEMGRYTGCPPPPPD